MHEAARIGAAAHGGQVLVSAITVNLAGTPPEAAAFVDLGHHHLRDIGVAIQLFQLTHPELSTNFPSSDAPPRIKE